MPLCEDPEGSRKTKKVQEKLQQIKKSCAEVTSCLNRYEEILNKEDYYNIEDYDSDEVDLNMDESNIDKIVEEDEQFHKNVEKEKEDNYEDDMFERKKMLSKITLADKMHQMTKYGSRLKI